MRLLGRLPHTPALQSCPLDSSNITTKPAVTHSRNNYWTQGYRTFFAGYPTQDSVGDTVVYRGDQVRVVHR